MILRWRAAARGRDRHRPARHGVAALIRRNSTTGEQAYHRCFAPEPGAIARPGAGGRRWTVEESFQAGKGPSGLDQPPRYRRPSPWRTMTSSLHGHPADGSFAATMSVYVIDGGSANSCVTLSSASRALPASRWNRRPSSWGNASITAKLVGPRRIASQAVVSGSSRTAARPALRSASTSASRPGLASGQDHHPAAGLTEPDAALAVRPAREKPQ